MSDFLEKYLVDTPANKRSKAALSILAALDALDEASPKVAQAIVKELNDQRSYLKLIASENYSSLPCQLAMGNWLTDKYSEGFPFHRFYAGCENVDTIEAEGACLAQTLFSAPHAYLQPHSGADANLVAFWAILTTRVQNKVLEKHQGKRLDELSEPEHEEIRQALINQKVMGLSLASGGHLTHGYRHNVSAKMMRAVTYDVDPKTALLDYDMIAKQAREEKPLILIAGYSAYPRLINFAKMRAIADEVGATLMVDMAHFAGLVAGGVLQGDYHPFPHAHIATTTTHKTLRGPRGGLVLSQDAFAESVNKGCPLVLGGPLPHVMAAKVIAFQEASQKSFATYAANIVKNAKALAEAFVKEGLKVVTGGTDNHLLILDLTDLGLTGRHAETLLREAKMTVNRNMVPFDKNGPWYTSGVRLGTPALTTLGMGPNEMGEIAKVIAQVLKGAKPKVNPQTGKKSLAKAEVDEKIMGAAQGRVAALLSQFPLYPEIPLLG